jgi:hypothetical protein
MNRDGPEPWDLEGMRWALQAPTESTPAPTEPGIRFLVRGDVTVDTWPTRQVVRITTPTIQIFARQVVPTTIDETGVVFSDLSPDTVTLIQVQPRGEVLVYTSRRTPPLTEADAWEAVRGSSNPVPPARAARSAKKPPDCSASGRIASVPRFRERDGRASLNFVLAVPAVDGGTVYHHVYSTGWRATQLRQLRQGQDVEVRGYRQVRQRDGREPMERIYALTVTSRSSAVSPAG